MDMPAVLVIEDDPVTRRVIGEILQAARFEAVTASDALEGMHALRQRRPDVIILDLMLPGVNGRTLAEALVSDSPFADVPILLMSGASDLEEVASQIKGATWIAKPFLKADLVRALRRLVARSPNRC